MSLDSVWRKRRWFLLIFISAIATLPVWIPIYPPLTDIPQHAAQVALLHNFNDPNFAFSSLFRLNWFTPYLLGYMLVYVLVPLAGIVVACKIVIALALFALPISTAFLMRETGTDIFWAVLTIPGIYGFCYAWGFLNYMVAAPIGIAFLAFAIRQGRDLTFRKGSYLAVFALALFFCHAAVCAFFLAIVVCYFVLEIRPLSRVVTGILPLILLLPIMLLWAHKTSTESMMRYGLILWDLNWVNSAEPYYAFNASFIDPAHPGWGRITGFIPRLLGVRPGPVYLVIFLLIFTLPLLAGARFVKRWSVWTPLVACLAVLLFVPDLILNINFVFQRFAVFVLPFYLIVLREPTAEEERPRRNLYRSAAIAGAIAWTGFFSFLAWQNRPEQNAFRDVLSRMEPGKRALSLVFTRDNASSIAPVFLHFPAWYSAEKAGMVDPNFAFSPPQLVVFRPEGVPPAILGFFEWAPGLFNWERFRGVQYDYFIVKAPDDLGVRLFLGANCQIRLAAHSGDWWVYEKMQQCN